MTFLNPLLLLGLLVAAIPLIIHLFNFRRPRRVDFSSLAFLKELQKSTMQRVRIKQLLLLALRMLALACLAMAFARPTITGALSGVMGGRARTSIAVVIDNSRSMAVRDAQGAYIDQAKALAAGVIQYTQTGDEVFILPTGSLGNGEEPITTRALAQDVVSEIGIEPASATLFEAMDRARTVLAGASHLNRELYVVSDLQRHMLADTVLGAGAEPVRTYVVPVGGRVEPNVAITRAHVVSRIVEAGQPVRIEATLVNYGEAAMEGYVASVFLEGERVAQAAADLPPRVPTDVSFTVSPQQRGWLPGEVRIEDDAFESDNVRYFTLNVPEQRRLLVVAGEGHATDFITLALSPELTRGRSIFNLETISETALATRTLGSYDAVALVGVRTLSSGEVGALAQYVNDGGGLLFYPGEAGQAADYNALFEAVGAGQFSGFSGALGGETSIASFDRVDLEHPLFEGVFEDAGDPARVVVERPLITHAMNYTAGAGNEQTLIQLSNGFPFLQEVRHGEGIVFLMAVAPNIQWSDLPRRGLFIPLVYRSMFYLTADDSGAGEPLVIGEPGEWRLTGVVGVEPIVLRAPDGEEFTPEQRSLLGAVLVENDPSLTAPGLYDVYAGQTLVRRVALNLQTEESDLAVWPADEAIERLDAGADAPVRLLDVAAGEGIEGVFEQLDEERSGIELWNVFLLLALVFLVAEMLLARQWRPEAVAA
ncbi:MAG: BatA domain-containing protein [Rhodothermales bacterium]|nr:BatA domain-containing protein [Rhodothermales bacterium]